MKKGYILILDSGVGGLSVLKKLNDKCGGEKFIYFGDNLNAPYGDKTRDELINIINYNIKYALPFGLRAIVLACNTLSTNVCDYVAQKYKMPVFGVFPPVEYCKQKNYKTLLLATPLTCKGYKGDDVLTVFPVKNLAIDIERNLNSLKKIKIKKYFNDIKEQYQAIILGCTHYELIKNKIFNHFNPQIIVSGSENCAQKVIDSCCDLKSLGKIKRNKILFIGDSAKLNRKFWKKVVNKSKI